MPIYTIQSPEGKRLKIKGDKPPTEKDMQEIFSKYSESQQEPKIMEGVKSLAEGRKIITDPIETARDPKATALTGLQIAQFGGQTALPWLSGVTTTPATEFLMQKIKGQETPEALKQAGISGGLDVALTGIGAGINKAAKPLIRKGLKTFAGIGEEISDRALNNPNILKGKTNLEKTFTKLGEKAQKAANYIQKEAGNAVGVEREALKNINIKFNFDDIANNMDELIKTKQFGRESVLSSKDIKKISNFSNKIRGLSKKGMGADELYAIRKQIDDMVKWDPRTVPKIGSEGEGILKTSRNLINNRLGEISPAYKKTAKKYADIIKVRDEVLPKLKDTTAASNIKNIFKRGLLTEEPVGFLEKFEQLDSLAPKSLKFADEAKDVLSKTALNEFLPKKGLLHNIRLAGALGAGGGVGAATGNIPLLAGTAALGTITSPRFYTELIKAGDSTLAKALRSTPAKGVKKQVVTRISDLLNNRGR